MGSAARAGGRSGSKAGRRHCRRQPPATIAAKAATATIPIVFGVGEDPVKLDLVTSLARPGGNLTGINFLRGELTAKRLYLLPEFVPTATRVAVLVNPTGPNAEAAVRSVQAVATRYGATNPSPQCWHQQRDQRRPRDVCARAAGRAVRWQRSLFREP